MAEDSASLYGADIPVRDNAAGVHANERGADTAINVAEVAIVTPTSATVGTDDSRMSYSMQASDSRARPDTIAEANASPEQLMAMYDATLAEIRQVQAQLNAKGINYTIQIPALASFDRDAIQAALNQAQANRDAAEGALIVEQVGSGIAEVATVGAVLGGAAMAAKEVSQETALFAHELSAGALGGGLTASLNDSPFNMRNFDKRDDPLGLGKILRAELRPEEVILALEGGEHFSRGSLGQLTPTHIDGTVMRHIDLTGEKIAGEIASGGRHRSHT